MFQDKWPGVSPNQSTFPAYGDAPKFSQIYLYDASDEIDAWVQIFIELQKDIFTSLQKVLDDVNPYAKLYHGT